MEVSFYSDVVFCRAGTREVHNKLEKNRRAHLKDCFDTLKKNVPNVDEKKTSNLSVLRSALRYIQVGYMCVCDVRVVQSPFFFPSAFYLAFLLLILAPNSNKCFFL